MNCEEIPSGTSLIKAGSSAENTRNRFPDEFDFVLVVGTYKITQANDTFYVPCWPIKYYFPMYMAINNVLNNSKVTCYFRHAETTSNREIQFCSLNKEMTSSQPVTFYLTYTNNGLPSHELSVDLIPAFNVLDDTLGNRTGLCSSPGLYKYVVQCGRYLLTRTYFSITETEVYFITKVLSPNHRKVYRILKYLINGHSGDKELLRVIDRHVGLDVNNIKGLMISSYRIKTVVIFHHLGCDKPNLSVGSCLLEILQTLKDCFETRTWPNFLMCRHMEVSKIILPLPKSKIYTESYETIYATGANVFAEMIKSLRNPDIEYCSLNERRRKCPVDPWVLSVTREIVLRNLCTEKRCVLL
jgi:hypothetical protein